MSRPPGHAIVPASGSTSTRAKYVGSSSGSNTPRHSRPAKSTSPTVPSANVRRSRYAPVTSTPVMSTSCSTWTMLRQRLDRLERLITTSPLPVGDQLVVMDDRPLSHERKGATRYRAGDQFTGEIDRRGLARITGVEMRRACTPSFQYIQIVMP